MYDDEVLDQIYITTQSGDAFLVEIGEGSTNMFTKLSIPQISFEQQFENESLIELSELLLNLLENLDQ